jgi:hypothetical protein
MQVRTPCLQVVHTIHSLWQYTNSAATACNITLTKAEVVEENGFCEAHDEASQQKRADSKHVYCWSAEPCK